MKKLISFFKNLFAKEEAVVEVAHKVEEVKTEAVHVVEEVKEVVEKVKEIVKEAPTKQIEERLAEVATEKKEEPKVTAKEIKAKVRRPAAPKVVVETPDVEATEVKRKPTRRKPKAKKAE